MGRAFESILDFAGVFVGNYDGRKANVTNLVVENTPTTAILSVTFIDVDRGENFLGETTVGINTYAIESLSFYGQGTAAGISLNWQYFLIATWDIDYISGVSTWDGNPYGMSFTRQQ
jgi:hypothetical protein